ncbi:MAG: hypothetical protein ACRC0X_06325 [Brevinema sp.]
MKYLLMMIILLSMGAGDSVVATVDNDLDLILLGSDFRLWYCDYFLDSHNFYPPDGCEQARDYATSYYWDKKNDVYYFAKMTATNGISYQSVPQQEKLFHHDFIEEITETRYQSYIRDFSDIEELIHPFKLLYVGSLSPLERIYIDSKTKEQYIKKLGYIITNSYIYTERTVDPYSNKTNYEEKTVALNTRLFPQYNGHRVVRLTNIEGQRFVIVNNRYLKIRD